MPRTCGLLKPPLNSSHRTRTYPPFRTKSYPEPTLRHTPHHAVTQTTQELPNESSLYSNKEPGNSRHTSPTFNASWPSSNRTPLPRRLHSARGWLETSRIFSSHTTAPTIGHRISGFSNASTPNSGNARQRRGSQPPTRQAGLPCHHWPHSQRPPTSPATRPTSARPLWTSRQPRDRPYESASIRSARAEASAPTVEWPGTSVRPAHAASVAHWPWQKSPSRPWRPVKRRPQRREKSSPMPHGWHRHGTTRISLMFCLISG